jgi:hypothetical protein
VQNQFPDLDDLLLQRLANIQRLKSDLNVPLLEMLSWWGNIDTTIDAAEPEDSQKKLPLYEQVFLSRSVDTQEDSIFELQDSRQELKQDTLKFSENATTVVGPI